jgi:hypothetical protein
MNLKIYEAVSCFYCRNGMLADDALCDLLVNIIGSGTCVLCDTNKNMGPVQYEECVHSYRLVQ